MFSVDLSLALAALAAALPASTVVWGDHRERDVGAHAKLTLP
jgi:hypothetical protein